jgi:uncharacterized protein (TIGR02246 family)
MNNRFSHAVLFLFVFVCLVAFSGHALAQDNKAAIDKVRTDFNTLFNKGDADAIADLFDRDAILMQPGRAAVAGKDKIRSVYAGLFPRVRSRIELKPGDIQSDSVWAFISGEFYRTDWPQKGNFQRKVGGYYMFVLKKQSDGSWKISRDIWHETMTK